MHRLRTQFFNKPLDTVLHPVSTEVQRMVKKEQVAADKALEQIEDVKDLVRQVEEKPDPSKVKPAQVAVNPPKKKKEEIPVEKAQVARREVSRPALGKTPWRLIAGIGGGILLITLCVWGGVSLWNNLSSATPEPTRTIQPIATKTNYTLTNQDITSTNSLANRNTYSTNPHTQHRLDHDR